MQDALKYYQIRQLPLQRNQTQVKLQRKKTVTTTKATTTSTTKASTTTSTTTTPKPAEATTTEQQQILGSVNNNDEELLGARTTIKIKWYQIAPARRYFIDQDRKNRARNLLAQIPY